MMDDLSSRHRLVGDLVELPTRRADWDRYRLSEEQLKFFDANGYLAGIRILDDRQVDVLLAELAELVDPFHPGNSLFYEYNSNESVDPARVLFHALGRLAVAPGFHDIAVEPGFHRSGQPVARRRGAILARSVVLQAVAPRRRGGLASGLFVLDAHRADGPSDLLDRVGRRHARQRLPAICSRQPSLADCCRSPGWPAT
jgi:hypothetical protein